MLRHHGDVVVSRFRNTGEVLVQLGFGWVVLPTAIDRKFPNADREWIWQRGGRDRAKA
jgi:hypothetical protein